MTLTISQVEGLTEGASYEFKIAASNLVGIGQPSDPSELFKCEAWTAPEPGRSHAPGPTLPPHAPSPCPRLAPRAAKGRLPACGVLIGPPAAQVPHTT